MRKASKAYSIRTYSHRLNGAWVKIIKEINKSPALTQTARHSRLQQWMEHMEYMSCWEFFPPFTWSLSLLPSRLPARACGHYCSPSCCTVVTERQTGEATQKESGDGRTEWDGGLMCYGVRGTNGGSGGYATMCWNWPINQDHHWDVSPLGSTGRWFGKVKSGCSASDWASEQDSKLWGFF